MVTTRDRTESDRHWLMSAVHEVPHLTAQLIDLHRARIVTLHESSEHMIEAIVILFAAFTTIGATLVVVVRFAARRGIALPIHRLANAAQSIAEGRLETRVSVRHANEIGLLSHSFNVMAAGLQEHDRALHLAQVALQEKVRELQALYRIGTEISRLQTLDRILQLVVDRARELLRCDAAALCIAEREGGGNLVPIATSGPPDAFRLDSGDSKAAEAGHACAEFGLFIRPEYARGYVASALRLGQAQLGTIQVGTREERTFTADESAVLSGLATQAAIAVERTRLLQDVHTLAVLEERERLAREMHDSLAQILGLLHLKLKDALEHTSDTQAVAAALGEMVKIADGGYEEVRQSIFGLRNFVSRGLGLVPTLTEYLHEFSAQAGIAVALEIADQPLRPVSPATEVQAVRIIQEALANVRKHAKADQARVRLKGDDAWIEVRIEDNGVGWDHEKLPGTFHFGLQTMRERAESLGGRLEIDTASGRGTRVTATLPRGGI
jgi:nitrate/nitrite-specific signal transduction histidine kinase